MKTKYIILNQTIQYLKLLAFSKNLIAIFFLAIINFGSIDNDLYAQSLFTEVSNENSVLDSYQENFRDSMINSGYYSDHTLVVLGHAPSLQDSGRLNFSIPGRGTTFYAEGDYVEYIDNINYTWSGRLTNQHPGEIMIIREGRGMGGYLQLSDAFYTLYPAGDSLAMMFTCDLEKWESIECTQVGSALTSIDPCGDPDNCSSIHDILILQSESGDAWLDQLDRGLGSLLNFRSLYLRVAFASTNVALMRSQITNHRYRFTVRSTVFNISLTDSKWARKDVEIFSNNSSARLLRNDYKADVMVLLTNQEYATAYGVVRQILAENDSAYCIVEVPYILGPRFTLSHEIAHVSGARHNRGTGGANGFDTKDICNHGFYFSDQDEVFQRTVMCRLLPEEMKTRINQFSNPKVQFNGAPTGDEDNDNSLALSNLKCIIQDYRSSPFWGIHISSAPAICTDEKRDLCAAINLPAVNYPGVAPYTYTWHYNFTGIFSSGNLGNSLGTAECETINITGPVTAPYVYIRLKVVSYDNQELVIVKAIKIKHENCLDDPYTQPISNPSTNEKYLPIGFSSNELNNQLKEFDYIRLFDYTGRVYFTCKDCTELQLKAVLDHNINSWPTLLMCSFEIKGDLTVKTIFNSRE